MKKLLTLLQSITLASFLVLSLTTQALAQGGPQPNPDTPDVPAGITNPAAGPWGINPNAAASGLTFVGYFIVVWRAIISAGAIAVLVYMLWGAFEWIVAGSEASKVQKARDKMTNAIIGLIILVGSFAIMGFIGTLIGFSILEVTFPAANTLTGTIPQVPNVPGN